MKRSPKRSALILAGVAMWCALPALAVVNDDLESYTVNDDANVANGSRFTSVSGSPGEIANGTVTANVAGSNVLAQTTGDATRVHADSDLTGNVTITFDTYVGGPGTHNIFVQDDVTGNAGLLIRFLPGDATRFFIQVQGSTGSSPPAYEALVDYGDWYRATIDLTLDPTPASSTFVVSFDNLTDATAVVPHTGTGAGSVLQPVSQINRLQIESPSGDVEFDNFTVPEPGSMALLGLGVVMMLFRRC